MKYNMFEIPEPVFEVKKRGRPKQGTIIPVKEPKKLGMPCRFNTLDVNGNTLNPRAGTLERRGKYIKQISHLKKYHNLDFPTRDKYEGKEIEVILQLIETMKLYIKERKKSA